MPATAWSVMIRLATTSGAPAEFGKIAKNARQASTEVRQLNRQIGMLRPTIDRVEPSILRMGSAFKTLSMDGKAAFNDTGRAAARLSRTVLSAGRVSASSFNAVTNTMSRVRSEANAASSAIGHMAAVARTVPRSIGPAVIRHAALVGGGAAAADAGGSGSGALGVAAAGAVAGASLVQGVKGAAEMQSATMQAAIGTGRMGSNFDATMANMADMRDLSFKMSAMTGQNIAQSMGVIASMGSAGVMPAQLKSIYKPIAQFTDILHFGKDKMEYGEAAKMGAGIVHDMRFFTPGDTAYGLGRVAQLAYLSPHGTNQLVTQIRRFAPTFENILPGKNRQKATTITEIAAWSDRMGNLPFAGSALSQMVTQMIAPRSERAARAMVKLGIWQGHEVAGKKRGSKPHFVLDNNSYFDKHTGEFDAMGALKKVAMTYANARDKGPIVTALLSITANAARITQALSSKEALTAYDRVVSQRKAMGEDPVAWMDRVQTQLMGELATKTQLLISNFSSLLTTIANPLIPDLTKLAGNLATLTGNLAVWFAAHPLAAKATAVGLGGVAIAGVVAALAAGGYVAHAALAPVVARLVGGHGSYIAARGATDVAHGLLQRSLVGTALVAGGTGAALLPGLLKTGGTLAMRSARGVGNLAGLGAFPGIAGLLKTAGGGVLDLALDASLLGHTAAIASRGGIFGITRAIGMFGLRTIPVIGEIVMLIQTIQFLGNHAKDIGHVLGSVAGWIRYRFGPMVLGGIKAAFSGLVSAVEHPRQALQSFSSFLMSVFGWIHDKFGIFIKAFGEGMEEQNGKRIDGRKLPNSRLGLHIPGPTRMGALPRASRSFDQPFHAIPAPRPVRTITGPGPRVHASTIVINANVAYSAPQGEDEVTHRRRAKALVRDHAQHVAAILADKFGADMHAGGAIPQLAGFSHHALLKGAPS